MSLTRRQFLKRLSLAAGVAAIGGLFKGTPDVFKDVPLPRQVEPAWAGDGPIGVVASGEHAGELTWASTDNHPGTVWIEADGPDEWRYTLLHGDNVSILAPDVGKALVLSGKVHMVTSGYAW